jgi:hypothetical protein
MALYDSAVNTLCRPVLFIVCRVCLTQWLILPSTFGSLERMFSGWVVTTCHSPRNLARARSSYLWQGTSSSLRTVCLRTNAWMCIDCRLNVSCAFLWEPCQQTRITASVTAVRVDVALFPFILELLLTVVTWSHMTFFSFITFFHVLLIPFFITVYMVE